MGSANTLSRPSYKSVRTTTMDNLESNIDPIQILAALQHLQQEKVVLRDSVTRLQNQPPPPAPVPPAFAMVALEPQISLPEKFDGTRLKFRGFVSQVRLIMQLHPRHYFDDTTRVSLLEPYSLGQLQHGLLPSWRHHPLSYKISTPLWRNLKQCLGTVTRPGLQPTSYVASTKGHIRPSSTPQNSVSLPATSIGEKLP